MFRKLFAVLFVAGVLGLGAQAEAGGYGYPNTVRAGVGFTGYGYGFNNLGYVTYPTGYSGYGDYGTVVPAYTGAYGYDASGYGVPYVVPVNTNFFVNRSFYGRRFLRDRFGRLFVVNGQGY